MAFQNALSATNTGTSVVLAFPGVVAGDLLCCAIRANNGPTEAPTVADDKNGNWLPILNQGSSDGITLSLLYLPGSAAGTVTITASTVASQVLMIIVHRVSGLFATSLALDVSASAAVDATTTPNSGNTSALSQTVEYIFGAVAFTAPDDNNYTVGGSLTNFRKTENDRIWTGDGNSAALSPVSAGFVLAASHNTAVAVTTFKTIVSTDMPPGQICL